MALTINSNKASLQAQRYLTNATSFLQKVSQRLASGKRINQASDDAAGLAIAEQLRASIDTTGAAIRNISDGTSLLNIADGALESASSITVRLKELAAQSANGTLGEDERAALDQEFQELKGELDRITGATTFNGKPVLDSETTLQVGIDASEVSQKTVRIGAVDTESLGISTASIATQAGAQAALNSVGTAVESLAAARGEIGAAQSSLEVSFNNLQTSRLELSGARSAIEDADIALEAANLVRGRLSQNIAVSINAQANQQPSLALRLLRG